VVRDVTDTAEQKIISALIKVENLGEFASQGIFPRTKEYGGVVT
jgi:hypothetical protein